MSNPTEGKTDEELNVTIHDVDEAVARAEAEDDEHCARTAVVRIVFPPGTKDDVTFDLNRALRKIREFGDTHVDELRIATDREARTVTR